VIPNTDPAKTVIWPVVRGHSRPCRWSVATRPSTPSSDVHERSTAFEPVSRSPLLTWKRRILAVLGASAQGTDAQPGGPRRRAIPVVHRARPVRRRRSAGSGSNRAFECRNSVDRAAAPPTRTRRPLARDAHSTRRTPPPRRRSPRRRWPLSPCPPGHGHTRANPRSARPRSAPRNSRTEPRGPFALTWAEAVEGGAPCGSRQPGPSDGIPRAAPEQDNCDDPTIPRRSVHRGQRWTSSISPRHGG
jgi:hypothetical protein